MKCAHPENKGNACKADFCPRGLWQSDWEELTQDEDQKCSYIRSEKWKPK